MKGGDEGFWLEVAPFGCPVTEEPGNNWEYLCQKELKDLQSKICLTLQACPEGGSGMRALLSPQECPVPGSHMLSCCCAPSRLC